MTSFFRFVNQKTNHIHIGQGRNMRTEYDEYGPYYTHCKVWFTGPPSRNTLSPYYVAPVSAHEVLHIAFTGGEHSNYEQDMFYGNTLSRYDDGYPLASSEIEKLAIKTIWDLERNPKLLHYFK